MKSSILTCGLLCALALPLWAEGEIANNTDVAEPQDHARISPGDRHWLFTHACANGDEIAVNILLRAGADVDGEKGYDANVKEHNAYGTEFSAPINMAARGGHTKIVKRLLESGAKADNPDFEMLCALFWAAQRGSRDIVELLLDAGADPRRNKSAAIRVAKEKGNDEILKLLVEAQKKAEQAAPSNSDKPSN